MSSYPGREYDYQVLEAEDPETLQALVIGRLQTGYELQGGVTFDAWNGVYMQAMWKSWEKTR